MIPPPKDIEPARLFRILLQRPRATAPLVQRVRGAEAIPLRVRALSSVEEAAIADAADGLDEMRGSRVAAELVCRTLLTPDGPAFASVEDVGGLDPEEAIVLAVAVRAALNIISPTYALHDSAAWDRVLQRGAKAPGNWAEALSLGGCVDYAFGMGMGRSVERPDRYFGIPLADMTDGQWMVYRAARAVAEELKKK